MALIISSVLTNPIAIMTNSQRCSERNVLSVATKHYSCAKMIYICIYLHCELSHIRSSNGGQKLPNMPSHPQDSLNQYIYFLRNYFYRLLRFKFARAATPSLCIAFLRSQTELLPSTTATISSATRCANPPFPLPRFFRLVAAVRIHCTAVRRR